MIEIREYEDSNGHSPFGRWFRSLDRTAAAKVVIALTRIGSGNFSTVKGVGAGVSEYKIDFGPGYRVYFGRDGDALVILVGGGSKKRQNRDIENAQACWQAYKGRKRQEQ